MTNSFALKSASVLILLSLNSISLAQETSPWQLIGAANFSYSSFELAQIQDTQYETGLFLDAIRLNKTGGAIGYIRQDQGLSNRDDIVNDILYLNGWYSGFPERVPGKVTLALNFYHGSESTRRSSGGGSSPGNPNPGNTNPGNTDPGNTDPGNPDPGNPDPGNPNPRAANPSPVTVTSFTDSLTIVNPVLSFMNYSKSLYLDIAYAASDYDTSNVTAGNLEVSQWSLAIGFSMNEQYDWLQLRLFDTDLSSDARTPGIDHTLSASLGWTHWLKSKRFFNMHSFTASLLAGERLYAVDHDVRKIYNLTDMQTGSLIVGANWKINNDINLHVYSGYERFEDVSNNDNYRSIFIYTGISKQW